MKAPLETDEQKAFVQYLELMNITYYAVPNGAFLKGTPLQRAKQMKRLKAEGLQVGVPDIVLLFEGGLSVYIELKRIKGSTTSKDQKDWQERLKVLGFKAYICKGAKEAIEVTQKYIPKHRAKENAKQGSLI